MNAINRYIFLPPPYIFILFSLFLCISNPQYFRILLPFLSSCPISKLLLNTPTQGQVLFLSPSYQKNCVIRGSWLFSTCMSILQYFSFTLHEQIQSYSQAKARKDLCLLDFPSETRASAKVNCIHWEPDYIFWVSGSSQGISCSKLLKFHRPVGME